MHGVVVRQRMTVAVCVILWYSDQRVALTTNHAKVPVTSAVSFSARRVIASC